MASTIRVELLNETAIAATTVGEDVSTEIKAKDMVFEQIITGYVADTFTTIVEHSADGTNWYSLIAFTAKSANDTELKFPTTAVLAHVRATCTLGAAGTANIEVLMHYSK